MISFDRNGTVENALNIGFEGLKAGQEQMRQASKELASANGSNIDLNASAVKLVNAELQTAASVEVIKRADGMIGTIIDTFA